jgi:flavin reductase (DIM6/NTAB) family NADH-FMN oxidoreductase RutF
LSAGSVPPEVRRYREAFGLFATGVAIVVGRAGEELLAMTVNAVSSVSLEPMLAMFCPGKKTQLARRLTSLAGFSINVLRHEQQALSTYFAGGWQGAAAPPFRFVPTRHGMRLEGCLASIDCRLEQVVDAGDHWMVIGRVLELHTGIKPHRPLLFFRGRYHDIDLAEGEPAPDLGDVRDEPPHVFYES